MLSLRPWVCSRLLLHETKQTRLILRLLLSMSAYLFSQFQGCGLAIHNFAQLGHPEPRPRTVGGTHKWFCELRPTTQEYTKRVATKDCPDLKGLLLQIREEQGEEPPLWRGWWTGNEHPHPHPESRLGYNLNFQVSQKKV